MCERWVERHILREKTSSSHMFFQEPGGANACTPLQAETPLIGCVSLARRRFSVLCPNLTAWFSSRGLLPVTHLLYPSALVVLSCLLITTWQLVKAHGITRNEPKIHGICYITLVKKKYFNRSTLNCKVAKFLYVKTSLINVATLRSTKIEGECYSSRAITFTFGLMPLEESINPLISIFMG